MRNRATYIDGLDLGKENARWYKPTSCRNTEILSENTPIALLHFVKRFLSPVPVVISSLGCIPSFHGICELNTDFAAVRALPWAASTAVIHSSQSASSKHHLGTLTVASNGNRGIFRKRIILSVPVKDKFPVVHFPDLPLFLVNSEVTRPNGRKVVVCHWGNVGF